MVWYGMVWYNLIKYNMIIDRTYHAQGREGELQQLVGPGQREAAVNEDLMYIYIYVYTYRERDVQTIYTYIYIYIYTCPVYPNSILLT